MKNHHFDIKLFNVLNIQHHVTNEWKKNINTSTLGRETYILEGLTKRVKRMLSYMLELQN